MTRGKETQPRNPSELSGKINTIARLKQLEHEGVKVHSLIESLDPTAEHVLSNRVENKKPNLVKSH